MKCGDANGQPASDAVDKVVRAVAEDGASTLEDAGRNFFIGWTCEDLGGCGDLDGVREKLCESGTKAAARREENAVPLSQGISRWIIFARASHLDNCLFPEKRRRALVACPSAGAASPQRARKLPSDT